MSFTVIIIVITAIVSFLAFNNEELRSKLLLWPNRMNSLTEYYRLLTCGFVHSDIMHLLFNMLTLYFFGEAVEYYYSAIGHGDLFPALYLSAIVASSMPSFTRQKKNYYYRSLGASGGVAAVVFAAIYFAPWSKIYILILPVPGIIAAIAYLVYSAYMNKKGGDGVAHDAHFWGAVYGFLFTLVFDPTHGRIFFEQLLHPTF